MGHTSPVCHSVNLLGFLRDDQGAPVYLCLQRMLLYLLFVVWIVRFHASLPALEVVLGFLPEEVRCQILYVFKHKRSLLVMLLFSLLKLRSNLGSSFHFVLLLQNNACQLTSFGRQGSTWRHHLFCSLIFNCWGRLHVHMLVQLASVTTEAFKITLCEAFLCLLWINWKVQAVDYSKKTLFQIYFNHLRMIILQ